MRRIYLQVLTKLREGPENLVCSELNNGDEDESVLLSLRRSEACFFVLTLSSGKLEIFDGGDLPSIVNASNSPCWQMTLPK